MRHFMYAVLLVCVPAFAGDGAKGGKPKDNGQFDDLFGKPADNTNKLDEMKKATEGVGSKGGKDTTMAPKVGKIDEEAKVVFLNVFAAQNIVDDKKLGCQPSGKDKRKVTEWIFDEVPAKANTAYDVCLTMQSSSGREMTMRFTVIDPRGSRVASYDTNVNFSGRTGKIDVITEFPQPVFKMAGQYMYVIDVDGKEAGRLPLFQVKVEGETTGKIGSTPSDLPPKQEKAPDDDSPLKKATSQDP